MIHVYTGNGKGKTTASLGLALRAAGHGLKVEIIQFMKETQKSGERCFIDELSLQGKKNINIVGYGSGKLVHKDRVSDKDIKKAGEALEYAKTVIRDRKPDMVILDEINVALDFNLIEVKEVEGFIKEHCSRLEIVLTGRNCPRSIIRMADYATLMKELKHPYNKGAGSRKGIEY